MKKRVIVLSLGGSLIVPKEIDVAFLKKFKQVLRKNIQKNKFVVVCGGGSVARKYISALRKQKINEKMQSMAGISVTRLNARFASYFFGKDVEKGIPHKLRQVKKLLKKQDIVFCGALEYKKEQTSDGTAAEIAAYFNSDFVNLTNVSGLHDKNPKKFKNAKFIPKITRKNLNKMVNKISYKPGQHFVVDHSAMRIILKNKIKMYNLDNMLNGKKFKGTIVN